MLCSFRPSMQKHQGDHGWPLLLAYEKGTSHTPSTESETLVPKSICVQLIERKKKNSLSLTLFGLMIVSFTFFLSSCLRSCFREDLIRAQCTSMEWSQGKEHCSRGPGLKMKQFLDL